ncbi:MAG: hypothetical protein E3K40_06240 [Candidatus Brocadia sp.]|nr:hypothetical protein [Candidatus Brocadia sp.]
MEIYRAFFILNPYFLSILILTAGCVANSNSIIHASDVVTQGHQGKKDSGEGKNAKFGKVVMQDNPVFVSSTLSPDSRTATLLFQYLDAMLDIKDKGVRVKTNTTTCILPVTDNNKELYIKSDIRGSLLKSDGARAVLLTQIGGKTVLIDLPKSPPPGGEDFSRTVEITLPSGQDYQLTLFLLVERDSDAEKAYANLTVDSIDITMVEQNTRKK